MIIEGRNAILQVAQDQLTYKNKVDIRTNTFFLEDLKAIHNELPFDKAVGFLTLSVEGRDFELNYVEAQAPAIVELVNFIHFRRPDLAKSKKANWFAGLFERRGSPRHAR